MAVDYEAEYNNRARVPEYAEIHQRWLRDAAAFRERHVAAEIGLRYGKSSRQTIDLFWPTSAGKGPLALFIHGGYWRSLDPSYFSHFASGADARGVAVAVVGYDLCPSVTVEEIIGQVQAAAVFLWRRHGQRLLAAGNSAGGHLAACLVATDWSGIAPDLPADLVTKGLSISGLYDLTPLVGTSMNEDLRLDVAGARRASPLFWDVMPDRSLDVWVGGEESDEFLRQNRQIAQDWGRRGAATRYSELTAANHFTVLDPLTDPESIMTGHLADLAWSI